MVAVVVESESSGMVDAVSVVFVVGGVCVLILFGVVAFLSTTVDGRAVFVAAVAGGFASVV